MTYKWEILVSRQVHILKYRSGFKYRVSKKIARDLNDYYEGNLTNKRIIKNIGAPCERLFVFKKKRKIKGRQNRYFIGWFAFW